jgi:hypothetical protein
MKSSWSKLGCVRRRPQFPETWGPKHPLRDLAYVEDCDLKVQAAEVCISMLTLSDVALTWCKLALT